MINKNRLMTFFIVIGMAILITSINVNAQWMPYAGFNFYGNPYGYWNQPYGFGWNQPYGFGWNQPYGFGPNPYFNNYNYYPPVQQYTLSGSADSTFGGWGALESEPGEPFDPGEKTISYFDPLRNYGPGPLNDINLIIGPPPFFDSPLPWPPVIGGKYGIPIP